MYIYPQTIFQPSEYNEICGNCAVARLCQSWKERFVVGRGPARQAQNIHSTRGNCPAQEK